MESVDKWSDFPSDLLVDVAMRQIKNEDFTAMRGVCTWWRAAATKDTFKGLSLDKAPPLLMLVENKNDECEFQSLFTSEFRQPGVPEAKGKRCMDARFGWIIAVAPRGGDVCLFNPFSSSRIIQLPNFHTFPRYRKYKCDPEVMFVRKAILSANPSETSNFMVFVLMNYVLGFWKNGDKNWTRIRMEQGIARFTGIGYGGRKMYASDNNCRVWSWDPSATHLTHMQYVKTLSVKPLHPTAARMLHMLELIDGRLVAIACTDNEWSFEAVRPDSSKGVWTRTGSMGKNAIFIDKNGAVSIDADDFPGVIMPNSIYIIAEQDEGRGKYLKIIDLASGTSETSPIKSSSPTCIPSWVFP